MALRFIDSMGHYGTATTVQRKWSNVALVGFQPSGGRRNAAYLTYTGGVLLKTLTHQTRYIQGAAIKYAGEGPSLSVSNDTRIIAYLNLNNDNTISIYGGNGENLGVSANAVADPSSFHYYEFDCTVGAAGNLISIVGIARVDNNQVLTVTGTTTITASNLIDGMATVNQVGFQGGANFDVMDYYCLDTSATDINGYSTTNTMFLGDVEIDALFPGTDTTTQWGSFGGDGTHAYTCVNETPPDDDTSYVFTTATGSSEAFIYQPISTFTGTIIGAQYLVCAKKTAEGNRVVAMTVGGTNVKTIEFQGTSAWLSDYYIYYIAPLDSDNGTPWTTAVFDAEKFGITLQT